MSTLRNKVQLIGNLGNDPEIITLDSGKKLAKVSLATNETYINAQGERITQTGWHYGVEHLYLNTQSSCALYKGLSLQT